MQPFIIRSATVNDISKLLQFEQGVIAAERPFDTTLKPDPIRYYDIEQMITSPNVELVVAEINGAIVGSGYARIENAKPFLAHRQYGYLGFMFVDEEHRGKGINQKIVDELKKWCASKNIFELRLEVYHQNAAAIKAYQKAGFEKHMVEMRMGKNEQ